MRVYDAIVRILESVGVDVGFGGDRGECGIHDACATSIRRSTLSLYGTSKLPRLWRAAKRFIWGGWGSISASSEHRERLCGRCIPSLALKQRTPAETGKTAKDLNDRRAVQSKCRHPTKWIERESMQAWKVKEPSGQGGLSQPEIKR
jgi:hypothetical protein